MMPSSGCSDDDDWFACLSAPGPPAAPVPDVAAAQPKISPSPKISRYAYRLPHPKKRTEAEHNLAACRMSLAKAVKEKQRVETVQAEAVANAVGDINSMRPASSALVYKGPVRGLVFVNRRGQGRRGMTFPQMLQLSFSPIKRLGDLSKTWLLDERWISKIQKAVAASFLWALEVMMRMCRQSFEPSAPEIFVSSIAFDESTEQLLLAMGDCGSAATRSSWHVMVSQQHVSWGDAACAKPLATRTVELATATNRSQQHRRGEPVHRAFLRQVHRTLFEVRYKQRCQLDVAYRPFRLRRCCR